MSFGQLFLKDDDEIVAVVAADPQTGLFFSNRQDFQIRNH